MTNTTLSSEDDIWELVERLNELNSLVTHPVRQFVTCLLSGFFVVGILLIIPALVQTAAAYVWAAQMRKQLHFSQIKRQNEHQRIALRSGDGQPSKIELNTPDVKTVKKMLSEQDRTLFLYRLLACTASLLVLILSTLPQLVFAIARPSDDIKFDRKWGWCHAILYSDYASRCFATYLIVVPFGLLFWNYLFSEISPRHHLLTNNVFRVILRTAIPVAGFSVTVPIIFVSRHFNPFVFNGMTLCGPGAHGLVQSLYYDFIVTRIIPVFIVLVIGTGFLVWLPREDYGVFYEPGLFLIFALPHIVVETLIHTFYQGNILHKLINRNFSNFMLIAYSSYHMSFSCTFVLATMRSVVSEIREEMRRRQATFLGEEIENEDEIHGSKRRTDLINGLQKQFSVAFRWKPDFTEEEKRTFIVNPLNAVLAEGSRTQVIESMDNEDDMFESNTVNNSDDVVLHYEILQQSSHLKNAK